MRRAFSSHSCLRALLLLAFALAPGVSRATSIEAADAPPSPPPSTVVCMGNATGAAELVMLVPLWTVDPQAGVEMAVLPNSETICGFGRRAMRFIRKVNPATADLAKAQAELDDWRVVLETRSLYRTEAGRLLRAASYDGHWSGQMDCTGEGTGAGMSAIPCRFVLELDLSGEKMGVVIKDGDERFEFGPDEFHLSGMSTHRFGWAERSDADSDGEVVESWSLAMTMKDPDHLLVYWTRVVNNVDIAADQKDSKWAKFSAGELVRAH